MNRTDLQQLAEVRIEEARLLFDAGKFDGAYYLAGYAVELGLKACVAKLTGLHDFYDPAVAKKCFTHKPSELVAVANLFPELQADMAAHSDLQENWALACTWNEVSRYERHTRDEADALIKAITDPGHGVLRWIRTHW
jgi:HEPN domain-containing protein